jgi:tetratricopeptide (TPR) repeat protein
MRTQRVGRLATHTLWDSLWISGQRYGAEITFRANYGGRLMDIGDGLHDPALIKEGISDAEGAAELVPNAARHHLLLNIASGYRKLYSYRKGPNSTLADADSDELSVAKARFNDLNRRVNTFDDDTKRRFFTEFGTCLSKVGRFLEGVRLYENALAIKPEDPVAIANLALAFREISLIANDSEVLREASEWMGKALSTNELDHQGGAGASHLMVTMKKEIDSVLASRPNEPRQKICVAANSYQGFCKRTQFFLNFCFHSTDCCHVPEDSLTFSVAEITDENRFVYWLRTVNEIKQQFAVARLLLFEALLPGEELEKADQLTEYLDANDMSVYGMRSGKIKVAYDTAFNILDKIGFFLNDYLTLGVSEKDVTFKTIWRDKKGSLRPALMPYPSIYLRGLYELSKELPSAEHFGQFTDVRNLLTHRFLVLHSNTGDWKTAADGDKYHLGYKSFFMMTSQLIGLAKAAAIYLVAFVRNNESQKGGTQKQYVRRPRSKRKDTGPLKSEV